MLISRSVHILGKLMRYFVFLICRLQATAFKKQLMELKIERISQTGLHFEAKRVLYHRFVSISVLYHSPKGIDEMPSPPPSPTAESTVMDIDVAQV